MPLRSALGRAACVLVGTSLTRPALGTEQTCAELTVVAEPRVVERWPTLAERVRSAFAGRTDIDRCARAQIHAIGETIALEVVLEDGRSTQRRLSGVEDVVPALEALLLLPSRVSSRESGGSVPAETTAKPRPAAERAAPPSWVPDARSSERDAVDRAEPVGLDDTDTASGVLISLGGGARMGDGQASENAGVAVLYLVSQWLVGVDGRAVSYEVPMGGRVPQSALELTAIVGHRIGEGALALDLMLGPTLVVQQDTEVDVGPTARGQRTTMSRVMPRLFFGSRLTLGARSVLGGFVGIEGAAGPSGGSGDAPVAAPPLPRWMLGFVVGVTVGIL